MNGNKIKSMLGFAIRGGKIVFGIDNIQKTKQPIYVILCDTELSERSKDTLKKIANAKNSAFLILDEKLEDMVFRTNCKAVAILCKNMSDNIINNAGNGGGNLVD